jgi:hypothetical protein
MKIEKLIDQIWKEKNVLRKQYPKTNPNLILLHPVWKMKLYDTYNSEQNQALHILSDGNISIFGMKIVITNDVGEKEFEIYERLAKCSL